MSEDPQIVDSSVDSGTADPTPQQTTPDPATADPNAAASATPTDPSASAPRPQTGQGMVPSYRIRETREAALREAQSQWAERESAYNARLEQLQRQLHAVVGVTPQDQDETTVVRQQFQKLFPGLAQLESKYDDVMGLLERSGDLESQQRHYWNEYGRNTMSRLYEKAEKSYGSPLNEDGKRILHASFFGYVSSNPDLAQRYTSDPSLVDEFWNAYSSNLIDPVRRAASATVQQSTQRTLPKDAPSGAPQATPAPKPKDLDERIANAWTSYQAMVKNK